MKIDIISALPVVPEEYELAHYNKIDYSNIMSEMAPVERQFINGLVRYYRPGSLLEIGVSRGGGTVNLLNAVSDIPNAHLTSIDKLEYMWGHDAPVGIYPKQMFPDIGEEKWTLIVGKDPSEVMGDFGEKYDFAVIDSGHFHPIESLNFLCVLPYLTDGAIVVLQDISLYWLWDYYFLGQIGKRDKLPLACRILQCSVVAEKLFTQSEYEFGESIRVKNIVAFQITPDTRKYISNVFAALQLPWACFPTEDIENVRKSLERHYTPECMEYFDKAVMIGKAWSIQDQPIARRRIADTWRRWQGKPVIFYGAGTCMRKILKRLESLGIPFEFPIWDMNADKIGEIEGHKVTMPDFETHVPYGSVAVITVQDKSGAVLVKNLLGQLGFIVITKIEDFAIIS